MTLKDKAKTYNFWISLVSAVILIVRIIGDKFNIFIDTTLLMDITTGLCSIFVVLGILSAPKATNTVKNTNIIENIKNVISNNEIQNDSLNSDCAKNINFYDKQQTLLDETITDTVIQTPVDNVLENDLSTNQPEERVDFVEANVIQSKENNDSANKILIEMIENLKVEINKANQVISDFSSTIE